MRSPRTGRRGFILYVAASIMVLVAILVFAYNTFVRGDIGLTFRALDVLTADTFALSAANIAAKRLHEIRADFKLVPGVAVDLRLAEDPLAVQLVADCAERYAAPLRVRAVVVVLTRSPFPIRREQGFVAAPDPEESEGRLRMEVEVEFRGVHRRLSEIRGYKLVNVLPPVYSHFTLFVSRAGDDGPGAYNVVANGESGETGEGIGPLFLDNGDALAHPIERRGWVYLGSGEVTLNLAQGYAGCGEAFHFIQDPTRVDLPDPATIIVNRYSGFFGALKDEPCIGQATGNWRSAWLKLYGNDAVRSLTLVIGDVKRAYVRFAALFEVKDERIRYRQLLPYLPPDGSELPATDDGSGDRPINVTDYEAFAAHMSNIVTTAYNVSFDFLFDLKINLAPAPIPPTWLAKDDHLSALLGDGADYYPNSGRNVPLASTEGGRYFQGDLAKFTVWPHLLDRAGAVFPTGGDLTGWLGECGGVLGGICRVTSQLDLSGVPALTGGGILLCDGDVKVGPLASDLPLVIVSRDGDIRVSGPLRNVGLVAERGRIGGDGPLDVTGFVAAARFRPDDNRRGGWIRYPVDFNPRGEAYAAQRKLMIATVAAATTIGFVK